MQRTIVLPDDIAPSWVHFSKFPITRNHKGQQASFLASLSAAAIAKFDDPGPHQDIHEREYGEDQAIG